MFNVHEGLQPCRSRVLARSRYRFDDPRRERAALRPDDRLAARGWNRDRARVRRRRARPDAADRDGELAQIRALARASAAERGVSGARVHSVSSRDRISGEAGGRAGTRASRSRASEGLEGAVLRGHPAPRGADQVAPGELRRAGGAVPREAARARREAVLRRHDDGEARARGGEEARCRARGRQVARAAARHSVWREGLARREGLSNDMGSEAIRDPVDRPRRDRRDGKPRATPARC